jgi:hypothetical protein
MEIDKIYVYHKVESFDEISAAEVIYKPPGHTAVVIEDSRIKDFSPQKEMLELMADVEKMQKR